MLNLSNADRYSSFLLNGYWDEICPYLKKSNQWFKGIDRYMEN